MRNLLVSSLLGVVTCGLVLGCDATDDVEHGLRGGGLNDEVVYESLRKVVDAKHMVAVTNADVDLKNRCVQVNIKMLAMSSAPGTLATTYCVLDTELDHD
jgi:hypothetical protein